MLQLCVGVFCLHPDPTPIPTPSLLSTVEEILSAESGPSLGKQDGVSLNGDGTQTPRSIHGIDVQGAAAM